MSLIVLFSTLVFVAAAAFTAGNNIGAHRASRRRDTDSPQGFGGTEAAEPDAEAWQFPPRPGCSTGDARARPAARARVSLIDPSTYLALHGDRREQRRRAWIDA